MANCNNYFRHPNGKLVTQFPYSGLTFAQMLKQVELDVFDCTDRSEALEGSGATP
jgi:hypothetical protein